MPAFPTHDRARRALEALTREPEVPRVMELLRTLMTGELLLDVTGGAVPAGSEARAGSDARSGSDARAGSEAPGRAASTGTGALGEAASLPVRTGLGPNGERALYAFTSAAELERARPDDAPWQAVAHPSATVLELVQQLGATSLVLDPGGPTRQLPAADLGRVLAHPRNDALAAAVLRAAAGGSRDDVATAFRAPGTVLVARDAATGQVRAAGADGRRLLLAFTSGPELWARALDDQAVPMTTDDAARLLERGELDGVVLNVAGPSVELSRAELQG